MGSGPEERYIEEICEQTDNKINPVELSRKKPGGDTAGKAESLNTKGNQGDPQSFYVSSGICILRFKQTFADKYLHKVIDVLQLRTPDLLVYTLLS